MTRRLLRGAGKWLGFITITVVTVFLGLFRTGHNAQDVAVIETSWQRSSSATFVATEPDGPSHLAQIEDELDHLLAQAHRVLDETSDILEERTWIGEPAGGVPDGGEPYDGNIASTTDLEPYPQVYFGPRKLLLICLFTGGTQFSKGDVKRVAGRVNAQMSSWAGKSEADVYYVTHMDVNTTYNAKRIWLPDLAVSMFLLSSFHSRARTHTNMWLHVCNGWCVLPATLATASTMTDLHKFGTLGRWWISINLAKIFITI